MDLTISKKNEVFLKIDSKEPHIFCELSDIFTFEVPGAKFMPQYRNRHWDGKIRLYDAKTGEEYIGPYYKTSRNEYFTGKNPQDKPNNSLVTNSVPTKSTDSEPLPESYYIIDDAYYYAKQIKTDALAPRPPVSSLPRPTENDYKTGEFIRYFLKKANANKYLEVDKKEYDLFFENTDRDSVNDKMSAPIRDIEGQIIGELAKEHLDGDNPEVVEKGKLIEVDFAKKKFKPKLVPKDPN